MSRFAPRTHAPAPSAHASAAAPRPTPRRAPAHPLATQTALAEGAAERLTRLFLHTPPFGRAAPSAVPAPVGERAAPGAAQASLTVGPADSPAEREADALGQRFADRLAGRDDGRGVVAQTPSVPALHRQSVTCAPPPVAPSRATPAGAGHALPDALLTQAEAFFGRGLGHVRVHHDGVADRSARRLDANAYTHGADVVFGAGRYAPHTHAGRELLGHELTHVLQQGSNAAVVQRDPTDAAVDAAVEDTALPPPSDPSMRATAPQEGDVPFEGELLRGEPAALRRTLDARVTRSPEGVQSAIDFVARLRDRVQADTFNRADISGVPAEADATADARGLREILPRLQEQLQGLLRDKDLFVRELEAQARATIFALLAESRQRLESERDRYGLTARQLEEMRPVDTPDGTMVNARVLRTEYRMRGVDADGLAVAARTLAPRRRSLLRVRAHWDRFGLPASIARFGAEVLAREERAYADFRRPLVDRHPVLAALEENLEHLDAAGRGAGMETAAILGPAIAERLENVDTVHRHLSGDGSIHVWRLDAVMRRVLAERGVESGSLRDVFVRERRAQVAADEMVTGLLLGAFSLAMALLAPATAGVSAAVGAGVSALVAGQHLQDYVIEHAMHGTDLEAARAISEEEPSLFWLALDILAAGIDAGAAVHAVGTAARTFAHSRALLREMAPLMRRLEIAGTVEEVEGLLRALREAIPANADPVAAERLLAHARRTRRPGVAEGSFAPASERLPEASTPRGHVSSGGPRSLRSGAEQGLESTPLNDRIGLTRFDLHPDRDAVLQRVRDAGFEPVENSAMEASIETRAYHHPDGTLTERRILNYDPRMRFLDMEHEVGHVEQVQTWRDAPPMSRYSVRRDGSVWHEQSGQLGRTMSSADLAIAEVHNRLREYHRLVERGAHPSGARTTPRRASGLHQIRRGRGRRPPRRTREQGQSEDARAVRRARGHRSLGENLQTRVNIARPIL